MRKKEGILSDLVRQESPRNVVEDWKYIIELEVEFLKYSKLKRGSFNFMLTNLNLTIIIVLVIL